jgi:glucose-1-phosphate thymidylyltransferase
MYPERHCSFWVQTEPLGLGHAVLQALQDLQDEPVLIILSDTIIPFNFRKVLVDTKEETGFLFAKQVDDPRRFGVMEINNEGWITRLVEKPEKPMSNLAIAGVYYLPSAKRLNSTLENLFKQDHRTRGEFQLTDALALLIENGEKLRPVIVDEWYDCGTSSSLLEANRELLKRNTRMVPLEGSIVKPPCWISSDVVIENSIIGPYVSIAEGVEIRNSIVSDSIINNEAKVNNIIINGSIVGTKAFLEGKLSILDIGPFSHL